MVAKRLPMLDGRFPFSIADWLGPFELELQRATTGDSGTNRLSAPLAVWDNDGHFVVEVDLPGVSQQDLELTVHKGVLQLGGERKKADGERHYLYEELNYGHFEHRISLPETIDTNSIEAELRDGVLNVRFSKLPESQPKKIDVKTG